MVPQLGKGALEALDVRFQVPVRATAAWAFLEVVGVAYYSHTIGSPLGIGFHGDRWCEMTARYVLPHAFESVLHLVGACILYSLAGLVGWWWVGV